MAAGSHQARRIGVRLAAVGLSGLGALGLAYGLTYEPAPRVRVQWGGHVTPSQQAAFEDKYLLVGARDAMAGGSVAYDLLDTSRSNIRALVEDPAVADTNDIDRHAHIVPFDVEYGEGWMWIAHRTPGLRRAAIRGPLIVALVLMAVGGFTLACVTRRST